MMLTFAFALPFLAAVVCLALNRFVDTRVLGYLSAVAMALSAVLLLLARARGTLTLIDRSWLTLDDAITNGPGEHSVPLMLSYDNLSLPIAITVAGGGALALLGLALALPTKLRGYSGLLAALLLLLELTLVGLAMPLSLLLPFAWAGLPILGFIALRASGGQTAARSVPLGAPSHLFGALVLLGGLLIVNPSGGTWSPLAFAAVLIAALLALGIPPFHRVVDDLADAPANVAAPLLAFGLAPLAAVLLTRLVATASVPTPWRAGLQIIGLFAVLVCGAAALRERHLRRLIGWQTSAQFGLLLVALGQSQTILATVAPALIIAITLGTSAALLVVGLVERRAGTDEIDQIRLAEPLVLPGVALALCAASTLGVPGTLGFLPLGWLYTSLQQSAPLLLGPLLAGAALLALAWVAPVASCWRTPRATGEAPATTSALALVLPLLVVAPLIIFGLAPQWAWSMWGEPARAVLLPLPPSDLSAPALPTLLGSLVGALALVAIVGLALLRGRSARRTLPDPEITPEGVVTPAGLGDSLRGLATLGTPDWLFARAWDSVITVSRGLAWALSFLEQRYYVAGLMIALVAVILLLMQG